MITFQQSVFYLFSGMLVFASVMVISIRNPVKAALFLVLAFFNAAGVWMTLEAEFLAIVLVLVYVGAVMVLFLFVVMMLDINLDQLREGFGQYLPVGLTVATLLAVEMAFVFLSADFSAQNMPRPEAHGLEYSNTKELGLLLYTFYVYPFEIAAVILLVAIVAAIVLTMRKRPETKYQRPADQIAVRREDSVRLVKMKTETDQ